jgi:hypothetical protein
VFPPPLIYPLPPPPTREQANVGPSALIVIGQGGRGEEGGGRGGGGWRGEGGREGKGGERGEGEIEQNTNKKRNRESENARKGAKDKQVREGRYE